MTGAITLTDITYIDLFRFLLLAMPGNITGSTIFVAVLKKSNTIKEHFDVEENLQVKATSYTLKGTSSK